MNRLAKFAALSLTLLLVACAAPEPETMAPAAPPGIDPVTGLPVDLTPGLNEREPDTCHAADYQYLMGQTEAAVMAAAITDRPTRMVTMGGIVSQEEYTAWLQDQYAVQTNQTASADN